MIRTASRAGIDKISQEEQAELTDAGRVTAEMHWERIEYLLERMIPVAEEFKVRLGNSQEDPPTPPGYKGVDKVLNDFEGMKRFIEIQRSPYHGWNFCVGSIAEMLEDPATEIYPFIEYSAAIRSSWFTTAGARLLLRLYQRHDSVGLCLTLCEASRHKFGWRTQRRRRWHASRSACR